MADRQMIENLSAMIPIIREAVNAVGYDPQEILQYVFRVTLERAEKT
jgi:hypothetical protein